MKFFRRLTGFMKEDRTINALVQNELNVEPLEEEQKYKIYARLGRTCDQNEFEMYT